MEMQLDMYNVPIPVGKRIVTEDGTALAITSPVTITSGNTINIKKPANAVELVMKPDNTAQISEKSDMSSYFETDESVVIGVADMENIYVKNPGSGDVVVQFYFVVLF